MDCWCDGQEGMTDRLAGGWTDSVTDLRVDRQTVGAVGMPDGRVAQQADVLKDGRVGQQIYRQLSGGRG